MSATQDRGMIRRDENSINIFHDKKNEAGYKRVLPGQFVIHLRSFQGGFAHSAIEGITSPAYTVFGFSEPEKHDSEYWKYVFTSKSFIRRLETVTYGIRDGRSISYEEFLTLGFVYPSKAEQTAIARYLDKLSDLITLHQRECISFTGRAGSLILTANKKRTTSSWEQRKLGDIGKARSGVGFPDADQGGLTGVPFFKVSDMNSDGNENEMTVANNYVTTEQIADHRWSPITELPAIFFAKVGAAVMLNRKRLCRFPFLLDNNTMAYSLSPTKWDADFAKALFGTVDLTSLVQVGALPSYNAGDVESMEIYLPSLLEQEQIGAYFKHLDNLITLHQRKFEKLTNVKKSMLEKMFPQNGSSYPEIRFKGFTDPWEQRKLGEIGSVSMCRRIFKEQTSETGDIPFYKIGTFGVEPDAFISRELFEEYKSKYPYPKKGDILISASGSIGRTVEFAGNDEYFQDSNIVWLSHDERLSNPFLKCFYSVVKWAGIEGSTIKRLYNDNILNTVICMPSVPEQECIGAFFENLDNLITLHQRELEKLQNIKKSMLEKMFV